MPPGANTMDAIHQNDADIFERAKKYVNTCRTDVCSLVEEHAQDTLSIHALKERMLRMAEPDSAANDKELQLDWDLYRDVPDSIVQEEALLLDYFRKLKFIYLEQETKLRFLSDLQDDPETGQEPQILSTADVAHREQECKRVKQQLVEAKTHVRNLRTDIDELADTLTEPWDAVEAHTAECSTLLSEITDMELELAKMKAAEGTQGSLTTAEAEAVCDDQILAMQAIDDETTRTTHEVEAAKRELADALRTLDRLKAERTAAEKLANDARLGMGRHRGRDWELERLCAKHTSTLETLEKALGIAQMSAPQPNELHITLVKPSAKRRPSITAAEDKRTIVLRFDEAGGRLLDMQLWDARDTEPLTLGPEILALTKEALHTNHTAALVQAVWRSYA